MTTAIRAIMKTIFIHGNQKKKLVEATQNLAVKDRAFAENLVFGEGLRGDITPEFIESLTKGFFNTKGRLTMRGRIELGREMAHMDVSRKPTWEELLTAPATKFDVGEFTI